MSNIIWFQLFKCEHFLLILVFSYPKSNLFLFVPTHWWKPHLHAPIHMQTHTPHVQSRYHIKKNNRFMMSGQVRKENKQWWKDGIWQAEITRMTDSDRTRGRKKANVAKLAWRCDANRQHTKIKGRMERKKGVCPCITLIIDGLHTTEADSMESDLFPFLINSASWRASAFLI